MYEINIFFSPALGVAKTNVKLNKLKFKLQNTVLTNLGKKCTWC